MRKRLLWLALVASSISISNVNAQNCAPNGITTNPAAPVNNQRPSKLNTFNWTLPSVPLNLALTGVNATAINSPFFTTDNANIGHFYDPIDGIKDVYPAQGWELIKKDFGFTDQGQPTNPGTTNPYLVLYNKYTSTLRVFVARGEINPLNGANMQIYFHANSPMQTSLLDHNAALKSIESPFTRNPRLNTVSNFLNLPLKWFYSDFPVIYDPCTCLFESKITIDITLSSTSEVTGTTETTGNLASQGKPTSTQTARGDFTIGDAFNTSKKVVQTYKTSSVFNNDIKPWLKKADGSIDTNKQTKMNNFEVETKKSSFLKTGLGSIPYIGDVLSVIDFFVGGGKQASAPQQVQMMPMSINMTGKYNGTIYTPLNYNTITFRTPGSNPGNAPNSEYPYYNEVLGLFNLLKTPKLLIKYYTIEQYGNNYFRHFFMKFSEDLQYITNPASGLEVEEIQFAIVDDELISLNGETMGSSLHYEGKNAATNTHDYRTDYRNIVSFPCAYQLMGTINGALGINPQGWRLKVMVNFKRTDATANTQNVLFVATYPITVQVTQASSYEDPSLTAFTTAQCTSSNIAGVSQSAVQAFCNSSTYKKPARGFFSARYAENLSKLEKQEQKIEQQRKEQQNKILQNESQGILEIYPNPTSSQAVIRYTITRAGKVKISTTNILSNVIEVLIDNPKHEAGTFEISFDGSKYNKGTYICIIETDDKHEAKKLILTE